MPATGTIRARWLFPVEAPPLAGGTLTIAGERIAAVEATGRGTADVDLGNVAILPGLVNAHTHLDLGGLRGHFPPPTDFPAWLREVVAYRRSSSVAEWQAAIEAGIAESLAHGTTLLGDISSGGLSFSLLASSPLRSVVFHELIGLTKERARRTWKDALAWLREHRSTRTCRPALSPHAPYTVRRGLFRLAARQAMRDGFPLAIHLAETRFEEELLRDRRGPLREHLEALNAWDEIGLCDGLDEIIDLNRDAATLYVHGNYLHGDEDLAGASVVYCPRTQAHFGHPPHPFRKLQTRGVNVALGTDSLASNPDLSILEEMRFLWRQDSKLPGDTLLAMGTLAGARALGWDHETGSLRVGKFADWIAVALPDEETDDPYQLLFNSSKQVCEVCVAGQRMDTDS